MLSLERATELNATMVTDEHLIIHAKNVCYAMGAMADYFGENREHWQAVGMLHDYDYEKYPEEHLQHTQEPLLAAGVPEEDVRAIMSHGWLGDLHGREAGKQYGKEPLHGGRADGNHPGLRPDAPEGDPGPGDQELHEKV